MTGFCCQPSRVAAFIHPLESDLETGSFVGGRKRSDQKQAGEFQHKQYPFACPTAAPLRFDRLPDDFVRSGQCRISRCAVLSSPVCARFITERNLLTKSPQCSPGRHQGYSVRASDRTNPSKHGILPICFFENTVLFDNAFQKGCVCI